jgi:hypothetical protein
MERNEKHVQNFSLEICKEEDLGELSQYNEWTADRTTEELWLLVKRKQIYNCLTVYRLES